MPRALTSRRCQGQGPPAFVTRFAAWPLRWRLQKTKVPNLGCRCSFPTGLNFPARASSLLHRKAVEFLSSYTSYIYICPIVFFPLKVAFGGKLPVVILIRVSEAFQLRCFTFRVSQEQPAPLPSPPFSSSGPFVMSNNSRVGEVKIQASYQEKELLYLPELGEADMAGIGVKCMFFHLHYFPKYYISSIPVEPPAKLA